MEQGKHPISRFPLEGEGIACTGYVSMWFGRFSGCGSNQYYATILFGLDQGRRLWMPRLRQTLKLEDIIAAVNHGQTARVANWKSQLCSELSCFYLLRSAGAVLWPIRKYEFV